MIHLVTFAKNISQDFVIELILPFILVQEKWEKHDVEV